MGDRRACNRCGSPLEDTTAEGYCLGCLLREGLAECGEAKPEETIQRLGNYELLEKVGEGGMGVVYRARQVNLDRIVAVKLLPFSQFSGEDAVRRFQHEASAASGLQHPNIVAIHDIGEHERQHYFSMDFIEGRTLAEVVREKPISGKQAALYLKTIAEAVHYAHEHGILHRDLKPSNVLIDTADQPHVTDFGLAKRSEGNSQITFSGQVIGSPSYIPPEQAQGDRARVSRQSDVYALGAMLYHLLTGKPPFQGETITETLLQVVHRDPTPPRSLSRDIPHDLETICLKCLEKEPRRRYATAQALAEDLARFLEHKPIHARPVRAFGKTWRWCRRQPAFAGMSIGLMLLFLLIPTILWPAYRASQKVADNILSWGHGTCFISNGLFYAIGNFRVPTRSISDSYVFGTDSRTWTVPEGKTLEFRADLVSLSSEGTNAAILGAAGRGSLYALYKTSGAVYLLNGKPRVSVSVSLPVRGLLSETRILPWPSHCPGLKQTW